jgi:hypothetical protein
MDGEDSASQDECSMAHERESVGLVELHEQSFIPGDSSRHANEKVQVETHRCPEPVEEDQAEEAVT